MTARLRSRCAFGYLAIAFLVTAGEQEVVLREQLNRDWGPQLVCFPFRAAEGECHRDSVRLIGAKGPVACQLSDIELWATGEPFVKSARVWFVTELARRATEASSLRLGAAPAKQAMPETDLRVVRGDGMAELTTSQFGMRVLLGECRYEKPVPASAAPGPVTALRLADGSWFGGSRLYGGDRVRAYSAQLTAAGPVFAEARFRYEYENGNTVRLRAQLAAGDSAVLWDAEVKDDRPESGWQLVLSSGLPALTFPVYMEWFTKRECFLKRKARVGDFAELPLEKCPVGLVTKLTPWSDWFDDQTQKTIRLKMTGAGRELRIDSREPGAWVEPAPPGTMASGDAWQRKCVSLNRTTSGEIVLQLNGAKGQRKWAVGEQVSPEAEPPKADIYNNRFEEAGFSRVGRRLNVYKDYVLDWPRRPGRKHPHLFLSGEEIAEIRRRVEPDPKVLSRARWRVSVKPSGRPNDSCAIAGYLATGDADLEQKLAERLKVFLDRLGHFDLMRNALNVVAHYDAVLDSPSMPEQDKPLLRAQMAFLGYKLADPRTWSIERGYKSGNPNMSVSYLLTLGMVACVMPDHPMAKEWVRPAIHRMRLWLTETVGPNGSWHESSHYAHVSVSMMVALAIAARQAGFHDFFKEPELKRLMMYLAKNYTPRDPQRGNWRVTAPQGRSAAGERFGLVGAMARATAKSDPAYSRVMQWAWKESGYSRNVCDDRFSGFEQVYLDPDLPVEAPDWASELFPRTNAVLRHGVGTEHEHYLNIFTTNLEPITRASEPGAVLKLFAKGRPVGGCFTDGYNNRQELLTSRVLIARSWSEDNWFPSYGYDGKCELQHFAALPRMDYLCMQVGMYKPMDTTWYKATVPKGLPSWPAVRTAGRAPVDWRRQVMFVKGEAPDGANYLVFRDTVSGDQPTMWQFWTLSEKIGTADEARDLEQFLADKPGKKPAPPRRLKGNRFTAIGQFGLDVEYYVASPKRTPRHTLRFGDRHEYMDMLHLQLEEEGHYFVALYPRLRGEKAPELKTLGGGTIIMLAGDLGTDYSFLASDEQTARAKGTRFEGTAACVQDRPDGIVLSLGAKGKVSYRDIELAGDRPASVRSHGKGRLEVMLPREHDGTTVTLELPGDYGLAPEEREAKIVRSGNALALTVPAGKRQVSLVAK